MCCWQGSLQFFFYYFSFVLNIFETLNLIFKYFLFLILSYTFCIYEINLKLWIIFKSAPCFMIIILTKQNFTVRYDTLKLIFIIYNFILAMYNTHRETFRICFSTNYSDVEFFVWKCVIRLLVKITTITILLQIYIRKIQQHGNSWRINYGTSLCVLKKEMIFR